MLLQVLQCFAMHSTVIASQQDYSGFTGGCFLPVHPVAMQFLQVPFEFDHEKHVVFSLSIRTPLTPKTDSSCPQFLQNKSRYSTDGYLATFKQWVFYCSVSWWEKILRRSQIHSGTRSFPPNQDKLKVTMCEHDFNKRQHTCSEKLHLIWFDLIQEMNYTNKSP